MHRLRITAAVFLIALFLFPVGGANALDVPQLKGRVNDYAGILSASTRKHLDAVLADLEQTDSTQVVVLTLPSLEGENLEAFSMRVAEAWKIGQKGLDNGAILLVALKERKIRIEVGYGLEGRLTDLVAGRIIRNVIVPRFKTGNFDQGITDGVAAMVGVVRGEYEPPQTSRGGDRPAGGGHSAFIPLLAFLFFINVLGRVRRGVGAAAGGILAPIVGGLFFNLGLLGTALLIPVGILGGFVLGSLGGALVFGHAVSRRGRSGSGIFWGGGGGFSSGGFGGFSGGGGGFGGGGASGGW
jgi:uncharacterized protein